MTPTKTQPPREKCPDRRTNEAGFRFQWVGGAAVGGCIRVSEPWDWWGAGGAARRFAGYFELRDCLYLIHAELLQIARSAERRVGPFGLLTSG